MTKIAKRSAKNSKTNTGTEGFAARSSVTGRFVPLHTVNADSKTFVSDLGKAFRSNVQTVLRKKK